MSIGGVSKAARLVTLQEELPGDIDGILDSVRRIMLLGEVQSIVLKNGEPLTYQRTVRPGEEVKPGESTSSFAELTAMDIVRRVQMEEYRGQIGDGASHAELVLLMLLYLEFEGWAFTDILLGESTKFWEWAGVPQIVIRHAPRFMGARITYDKTLPEDVFIFCGAKTKNASIVEISYALKGNCI